MSLVDYHASRALVENDPPFYGLVMAAMRRADGRNLAVLKAGFPETWAELQARYEAPGGLLDGEVEEPFGEPRGEQ